MSERLQHLVLVRHGKSEGDERRAAWRRGDTYWTNKTPENELLTPEGEIESHHGGLWLKQDAVLGRYALQGFDEHFVSAVYRNLQSAVAMDLPGGGLEPGPAAQRAPTRPNLLLFGEVQSTKLKLPSRT